MSFNSNPGKQAFTATASQTNFDFNFKIYVDSDIKVYLTPTGQDPDDTTDILILDTDYTVSINGDLGGSITLLSGATLNDTIVINRDLPVTRDISYVTQGDLLADTINLDQNYQTYLIIDSFVALNAAIVLPVSATSVSTKLPAVTPNSYLRWNSTGDAIENDTTIPDAVVTTSDNVLDANSWANEAEDTPVKVYTNGVGANRSPMVYSALHYQAKANGFSDEAELEKWDAEAKALTSLSYATEPEDIPVNLITSDGDGTFTYAPQAGVFSALHYSIKSGTILGNWEFVDNKLKFLNATGAHIHGSTTDGSDTGALALSAGGNESSTRGAVINLYGEQHDTWAGELFLTPVTDAALGRINLEAITQSRRGMTINARWDLVLGTYDAKDVPDPDGILHVLGNYGTLGVDTPQIPSFTAQTNANLAVFEQRGTSNGITIATENSVIGRLAFGDPENAGAGQITYNHADENMVFSNVNGESARIDENGKLSATDYDGKNVCSAWVRFNGQTTPPTIIDSYNVSSVERISTGKFRVHFATSLPVGYSASGLASLGGTAVVQLGFETDNSATGASCDVTSLRSDTGAVIERALNTVSFFGGN
jgi:hypothetical protein